MRWMLAVPVLTLALATTSALAQAVYKCTDANGRTTYTNPPCAHNKLEGQVLMRERSLSERIEERMQYREALEAKHERQRTFPKKQRLGEHLCQAANARPAWPTSSATAGAQHHHPLRWRFLL